MFDENDFSRHAQKVLESTLQVFSILSESHTSFLPNTLPGEVKESGALVCCYINYDLKVKKILLRKKCISYSPQIQRMAATRTPYSLLLITVKECLRSRNWNDRHTYSEIEHHQDLESKNALSLPNRIIKYMDHKIAL